MKAEAEPVTDRERLDFVLRECLPVAEWDEVDGFAKIEIKLFVRNREDIDKLMKEKL
jgi:hypothetical protein